MIPVECKGIAQFRPTSLSGVNLAEVPASRVRLFAVQKNHKPDWQLILTTRRHCRICDTR